MGSVPPRVPRLAVPAPPARIGHEMLAGAVAHVVRVIRAGADAPSVAYVADRLFAQISAADPGWSFVHLDAPDASHVFCGPTVKPIVVRSAVPVELWRVPPRGIWPIREGAAACTGAFATDNPNYGDADAVRQV